MNGIKIGVVVLVGIIAACSPEVVNPIDKMPPAQEQTKTVVQPAPKTTAQVLPVYTPPEASGLIGVRPYPDPDDVCEVIGENALTNQYLDHTAILIGCPVHEKVAIADRIGEGAQRLPQIGDWVLLSVPEN